MQFRQDFLGPHFFELKDLESVARLLGHSANGLAFSHTETVRMVAESLAGVPTLPAAKRLVAVLTSRVELAGERDAPTLSTAKLRPMYRVADQQRIDAICLYLNEHFADEGNFARLARRFQMNPSWMCRFFKRATGRAIAEFLNELRVTAAAQLLIDTNHTLLHVAFRVGYGNYSNFSRQFKWIRGMSPRAMRRQFALTAAQ